MVEFVSNAGREYKWDVLRLSCLRSFRSHCLYYVWSLLSRQCRICRAELNHTARRVASHLTGHAPPTTAPRTPATVANPHIVRSLESKETHIQSHNPPLAGSERKAVRYTERGAGLLQSWTLTEMYSGSNSIYPSNFSQWNTLRGRSRSRSVCFPT